MKRGRTALTAQQHVKRALDQLGIKAKTYYRRMINKPGAYIDELIEVDRTAFGSGPNRKVSVLLVPELRKRRSERNAEVLAQQIRNAGTRLAEITAGKN